MNQNNPLLAAELERVERGEPLPQLDTTRHQLPAPEDQANATEEEWKKSLQNAKAQLEHQRRRYPVMVYHYVYSN
jgi:multidrug efflux pump subunit AcrA (membrane-fusion protein)